MQTILAIDDERSVRKSYEVILGDRYRVILEEDIPHAFAALETHHVDLILLDLTLPGMSGEEFLEHLRQQGDPTPVIVVTGNNSVQTAVTCMKHGARDFVTKPFSVTELQNLVERVFEERRARRELAVLREHEWKGFEHIIGEAPPLRTTLERARQAMNVDSTVLITGESGTGKDLVARAIHSGGRRAQGPYVAISCCAIPHQLVESELFGHVKGAFTGATDTRIGKMQAAGNGTLFLDEIGEMPLDAQAKLLRVLQDGCFYPVGSSKAIASDARIVCATNRELPRAISEGIFREDLFYRINVLPIEMPPLRRRREDIPRLVAHFVAKHGPRANARCEEFSQAAMARLTAYRWPGNVRELENTIERLLVCNSGERVIQAEHLNGMLPGGAGEPGEGSLEEFAGLPLAEATARLEHYLIRRALERNEFNQSQTAASLGTTRRILKYKMDQLGIIDPAEPDTLAG
jgi:DNA-binding NtrC family response regulator